MSVKLTDIEVKVTRAEIRKIEISYVNEDLPELEVTVDLKLNSGDTLTTVFLRTDHYNTALKIEAPISAYPVCGKLLSLMTQSVKDQINGFQKVIEATVS